MASYNLVLDTKFKPFSYTEMVAPVIAATQAHQTIEEEYGNLAAKASVWENMANEQTDPYTYKMYKTYSNDLEQRAEQLMKYGLTPSSRRDMFNMRERYNKEITPIETAYNRRLALMDEQRKQRDADKTIRFEENAADISLDDLIRNPTTDYGRSYSGAMMTKQVADMASSIQNWISNGNIGKLESLGLPYQYIQKISSGVSPDDAMTAIYEKASEGDSEAVQFLRGIVDLAMGASGVAQWKNPGAYNDLRSYANMGLYKAIGKDSIKEYKDDYSLQIGLLNERARREAQVAAEEEYNRVHNLYRTNSTYLFSPSEIGRRNMLSLAELKSHIAKGYITQDGIITDLGKELLAIAHEGGVPGDHPVPRYSDANNLYNLVSKYSTVNTILGADGSSYSPIYDEEAVSRGIQDTLRRERDGKLASGVANIKVNRITVHDSANDRLVNLMTTQGGNIEKVGILKDDGTYSISKHISVAEFRKKYTGKDAKGSIVYIENNPASNQQTVLCSDGERYIIPSSVFGNSVIDPINHTGDLDTMNEIMRAETKAGEEFYDKYGYDRPASDMQVQAFANADAYLSTLLDYSSGVNIDRKGSVVQEYMGN